MVVMGVCGVTVCVCVREGGGGTGLPNLFSKLAYLSLPFLIMDINRFMF